MRSRRGPSARCPPGSPPPMPPPTSFPPRTPGGGRGSVSSRSGYSWRWARASRSSPATPSSPGTCTSCGAVDRMSDPFEGLFDSGRVLERMGVDLTAQARRGDLEPVRCRDAEIARVIDILLRQNKNNPALIGIAGVGKAAIGEGLAQRIAAADVPQALKDAHVVALDHVALLAGTAFRGQDEERIRKLVRELSADPGPILVVDELHNLIGQGTALGAAMDAANMLKPALVRGDIRVIGATTGGEYDKWIR